MAARLPMYFWHNIQTNEQTAPVFAREGEKKARLTFLPG